MAKILKQEGITFDDILIVPLASGIEPHEASLKTEIAKGLFLDLPIISAAMDRVTESKMLIAMSEAGGLGVLHRSCTIEEQVEMVREAKEKKALVGAACGPFDEKRAEALAKAGVDLLVIDCAHGHNKKVIESAKKIKKILPKSVKLMVGNVATEEAAKDLVGFVDAIKVGVGPGSICTTRVVSGVGVPQVSAVMDVVKVASKKKIPVIADGGMRASGDMAKAIGAGANGVMLGNLLSGTDESPGDVIEIEGKKLKEYRGMGSRPVLEKNLSTDRYLTGKLGLVPEGVEAMVHYKGSVTGVLHQLKSGIEIAMGYTGAKNIKEFQKKVKFVKISKASFKESKPHSLDVIKDWQTP